MANRKRANKNKSRKTSKSTVSNIRVAIRMHLNAPPQAMELSAALGLAAAHEQQQNAMLAEFIYMQLIDQCPGFPVPGTALLRSLMGRGELEQAYSQALRLQSLFRNDAALLAEVSNCYMQLGKPDQAIAVLEAALSNGADATIIYRAMATVYRVMGDKARAVECLRHCLAHDENDVFSLFSLAELDKKGSGDYVLSRLSEIERSGKLSEADYPYLHFALAYLMEADSEKYFAHLQLANSKLHNKKSNIVQRLRGRFEGMVGRFQSGVPVAGLHEDGSKHRPIFILAPPRSGTTLVEQILGAHSETKPVGESFALVLAMNKVAREEQLHPDLWQWSDEELKRAQKRIAGQYYANKRVAPEEGQTVVDKSIENVFYVGLILSLWPDAKIIRLKRHPLDTILSCFHHSFAGSPALDYLFDLESLGHFYAIYQQQMDFWQQLYPDSILSLSYEDLVSDPESYTRQLLAFCELPWDEKCLDFHQHVGSVLTVSTHQVRNPIYSQSVDRWKRFYPQLAPARKVLEAELNLCFEDPEVGSWDR